MVGTMEPDEEAQRQSVRMLVRPTVLDIGQVVLPQALLAAVQKAESSPVKAPALELHVVGVLDLTSFC